MAEWLAYIELEGLASAKQDYWMAGQLCSAVANFSTFRLKKPVEPEDFFPTLRKEVAHEPKKRPTKKQSKEAQPELLMAALFKTSKAKAYNKGA